MARTSAKNIFKLIDMANDELPIEQQFINDLKASIEKSQECKKPSQTYKPSGMNCVRAMTYQVLGVEPDNNKSSYQLIGICESGTDMHIRIQSMSDESLMIFIAFLFFPYKYSVEKIRYRKQRKYDSDEA